MGGREAGSRAPARRLRRLAKRIFLSEPAQRANSLVDGLRQRAALRHWQRGGRSLPPPHLVKQHTVRAYAHRFSLTTLVETGTYLGAMIRATSDTFDRVFSIELDPELYERACKKLSEPGRISILNGDSAEVLPQLLAGIHEPCLFWLDAHHSGPLTAHGHLESPVMLELRAILEHGIQDHVVLIDDAHAFAGQGGYPTIPELRAIVGACRPDWVCVVEDDIIRLHLAPADLPRV